jgi:hypothetical protein
MTENEIHEAQNSWGAGVVNIGQAKDWQQAFARATDFVSEKYIMDGSLLFAPTKARDQQFRPTLEAAVSYFVGQNPSFPEDKGFALQPWTNVRFENTGIRLESGDLALAMGNYFFTTTAGDEVKVEYTFGYKKVAGAIKIILHHSALPFAG